VNAPSLHEIARAMGGEVRGERACFPTPGHSKKDRGSWASIVPGAPDGVLVHSSNGGDPIAIKDQLRAMGVLPPFKAKNDNIPWRPPERESAPAAAHAVRLGADQRIVATFDFVDGDGVVLHRKHRIEPGPSGRDKTFAFDRPDGSGGWVSGQGEERIPYRLRDILAAPKDEPLYLAEGEAKADRLADWGLLASSHKDWKGFEWSGYVKGRTVFILPDNDKTGRDLAEKAREGVERAGGTPHLLELPGLPETGDILDWAGTREDLQRLSSAASDEGVFPTVDLAALARVKARPKRFVIERLAPAGEVTLFTGPGSAGKSLLAQQLATAAAAGKETLGFQIEATSSIYVTCEDDVDQLHWRQEHISAALGAPMDSLTSKLHLSSLRGNIGNELATFAQDGRLLPTGSYKRLVATLQGTGARVAFLDNVAHLFAGNENDRGEVTRFVNLLNRLAGETDAAIILLGHPNKAGDSYSGSTAWLNAVRSHFSIEHDPETDARTLNLGKANYAQKGDQVRFFWQDWAFIGENELPPDRAREFMESQRAAADNERFLACLKELTKQRRPVSESRNAANYGPKVFVRMPEAKGLTRERLEQAMDRLFRIGMIEKAELWKGVDRKAVYGLRTVADGEA